MSLLSILFLSLFWVVGFVGTMYLDAALRQQVPVWNQGKDHKAWLILLRKFFTWWILAPTVIYDAHKLYS